MRYARSSLAVVVFFIVKSESKRSPGTDFAAENMKEHIQAIFAYIAANFRVELNSDKTFKYSKFRIRIEYSYASSFTTHIKCPGCDSGVHGVLVSQVGQQLLQGRSVVQVVDEHVQTGHDAHDVTTEERTLEVVDVDSLVESRGARSTREQTETEDGIS